MGLVWYVAPNVLPLFFKNFLQIVVALLFEAFFAEVRVVYCHSYPPVLTPCTF